MRIGRMVAAIVGAALALWLLQGDTGASEPVFTATATAIEENTAPTGNIRVYQVRFADGSAVTVMGSEAVPFVRFLSQHERIAVDVRPYAVQRIER